MHLEHRGQLRFTADDIAVVARELLDRIASNIERGDLTPNEAMGSRATVVAIVLLLGLTVGLGDGTYLQPEDYGFPRADHDVERLN